MLAPAGTTAFLFSSRTPDRVSVEGVTAGTVEPAFRTALAPAKFHCERA